MNYLIITPDGELKDRTWQEQYELLRRQIIDFCIEQQENTDFPALVTNHLENIEIDFDLDDQPLCKPGNEGETFLNWTDKKQMIQHLLYETEAMVGFGDPARFTPAINVLKEAAEQLRKIIDTIPD